MYRAVKFAAVVCLFALIVVGGFFLVPKNDSTTATEAESPEEPLFPKVEATEPGPVKADSPFDAGAVQKRGSGKVYRVRWPDLEGHIKGKPVVVESAPLGQELMPLMEKQIALFKVIMALKPMDNSAEALELRLDALRQAFPEKQDMASQRYQMASYGGTDDSIYIYQYPIERSTSERIINDFRHVVVNARLDEIDHVIESLERKLGNWDEKLDRVNDGAQVEAKADRAFLDAMPAYIAAWNSLNQEVKQLNGTDRHIESAKRQWLDFESNELPQLNHYIKAYTASEWPVGRGNRIEDSLPSSSTLYLRFNIAGREIYFPLRPYWDAQLGMAIVEQRS